MPINKAGSKPPKLTKEQKKGELAAVYGLKAPMQFDPSLVNQMRAFLAQHDSQNPVAAASAREFDLAKPPVPPYNYQDYPRILYNHATGTHKVAANELQAVEFIESGYLFEPPALLEDTSDEVALSQAEQLEIAALNKKARQQPKK